MDFPVNPTELTVAQYLTAAFATLQPPTPGVKIDQHKKLGNAFAIQIHEYTSGNMEATVLRYNADGDEAEKWRKKLYHMGDSTPEQMRNVLVEQVVQSASTGIMEWMYPPTAEKVTVDPWFVVPTPYVPEPIPVEDNPAGDYGGYEWLYGGPASPLGAMP